MKALLIANGRVIDPAQNRDEVTNLLLRDGRVAAVGASANTDAEILDATGMIVTPGLIDIHTQLREPGFEEDETIATGAAAALAGGYTTIACLPNTAPPIDTQASVEFVQHQAERANHCNVVVIACISQNRDGEQLAEMGSLAAAGAVAFSDAPRPVASAELMRRALQYGRMFGLPILNRPEVPDLTRQGVMHEGFTSMVLGLSGMPAEAEDVMTARDIHLAASTEGRLHLLSLSTRGSLDLVRRAKRDGIRVTADISPPNFILDDERLRSFDSRFKLNPPLRSFDDVAACIEALKDGTLDIISSGHAPFASEKKMQELDLAPFGATSLETVLPLVITHLIRPGHLSWSDAIAKLSTNPARLLQLTGKGSLQVGADADVTIIDPDTSWEIHPATFQSMGHATPFEGFEVTGRSRRVLVAGVVKPSPSTAGANQ